jgi:glutathione-specific gamma-glutamylcyclotransferase
VSLVVAMPAKPAKSPSRRNETPSLVDPPRPAPGCARPHPSRIVWVFGYGSLMWNPGFRFRVRAPALVRGWHRAFCVYSHVWRGTPEKPGLVLGLDRGGSCRGIAYAVDAKDEAAVLAYLDERERVTNVYARKRLSVALGAGKTVPAWSYIAVRDHAQYAGKLTLEHAAALIVHGMGKGGSNPEYLENTIAHLDSLGIPEGPLHALRERVRERML